MENKYFTPIYDKCLENLGWYKFETHPIYCRKINDDKFEVNFNTDFISYQLLEEQWINEGRITEEAFQERLKTSFEFTSCKNISSKLTYSILLALTADFYYHNRDKELHELYKKKYEQFSGNQY